MSNENKRVVRRGFKKFAYQLADEVGAKPVIVLGAVTISAEKEVNEINFSADDLEDYYTEFSGGKYSGEVELASLPDKMKIEVLGYIRLSNGALALPKNPVRKNCHIYTEGIIAEKGKAPVGLRKVFLNCNFGYDKGDEQATGNDIKTTTVPFNVNGITLSDGTFIEKFELKEGEAGYDKLYTDGVPADLKAVPSV